MKPPCHIFIQSNYKQLLGARLAKFAIERSLGSSGAVDIQIINTDELKEFRDFDGKEYAFNAAESRVYRHNDLQSFTLCRFMPPELLHFKDQALVIDPDIFALSDIHELFEKDMGGHAILACPKKSAWDSSVMLLDCKKLAHWRINSILDRLANREVDYTTLMTLKQEDVGELGREWNSLDILAEDTKMLHTTERLTQPWKTGLPIDFTRNKMPKLFGIIPREPIHKLLGRYPAHYQPHPKKNIEQFFFVLVQDALAEGAITKDDIQQEIDNGNIRSDFLALIS